MSSVHLAHAALAEQCLQLIPAEGSTGHGRRHVGGHHVFGDDEHGCGEEPIVGPRLVQQRFDLPLQRLVASTSLGKKI